MNRINERNLHIQMMKENLLYNKDSYSMDVSAVMTSSSSILLRFNHLKTGASVKFIVLFDEEQPYITLSDQSTIDHIADIFNVSKANNLNTQILEEISLIFNQHDFVNCFLFGSQKCSFDNNYTSTSFKINNPTDLLTFSKELQPFLPRNCLRSYLNIKFLLLDDFSCIKIDCNLTCRIDGGVYSHSPEIVFKNLLTKYACDTLDKNLEDLTLSDHVLLQMVKI